MTKRLNAILVPYCSRNGEVLVYLQKWDKNIQRAPDVFGFWGGGFEGTETVEQALIREIKEELDYESKNFSLFKEYDFSKDYKYIFIEQVNDDFDSQVKILKGEYGKWFSQLEMERELKMLEDDKLVLRELFSYLSKKK